MPNLCPNLDHAGPRDRGHPARCAEKATCHARRTSSGSACHRVSSTISRRVTSRDVGGPNRGRSPYRSYANLFGNVSGHALPYPAGLTGGWRVIVRAASSSIASNSSMSKKGAFCMMKNGAFLERDFTVCQTPRFNFGYL